MKNFSKLGLFKSRGRIFNESASIYRTPFQRDRDRIIHSASFRRLKHKTQVFVNTEGDHYRTRITHSIEVAQIARTIAKYLNLNDDLAETLSLAHDLGHTPFGHAGEDVLNECMNDYGGFDHNLQTIRIVMFLENKYLKFKGLNLTVETLDGLLKHNGIIEDYFCIKTIIGLRNFKNKINLNFYLTAFICINLVLLSYGHFRKTEAYHFRKNLINELKNYGPIPKGDVLFIGKNIPVDIRTHELNYLLYKAYNIAGWWSTPFGLELSKIPSTNELKNYGPNPELDNDERYSKIFIFNEYKYECSIYIYIKNDLKKYERLKKFYIFNYKKNYNIDKVIKKC